MRIVEDPSKTFYDYYNKICKNISDSESEKVLLLAYLISLTNMISDLDNKDELKEYAISELTDYINELLFYIEYERSINASMKAYLDSLFDIDSFVVSSTLPLFDGILKSLEYAYFNRVKEYGVILNRYYFYITKNFLSKKALRINNVNNPLDEEEYKLMLGSIPKK